LFAAIDAPVPVQQQTTAWSARPSATSRAAASEAQAQSSRSPSAILRAIPALKERLQVNLEIASPVAKVERGHRQDLDDVQAMVDRGLVDPDQALSYFAAIEPDLYKYPAIDHTSFRTAVERTFGS
jgi:hypothetical protein